MKLTEKARESLHRLLKSFEEGTVPEAIAHTIIPALDVPSSKWSLNNRLLVFLAGTSDARGIRQWNEVGRKVIEGKKAFYILAPTFVKAEGEDGKEEKHLAGFRSVPVFSVEDTEGAPLDYPPLEPPQPPPLSEVAEAWGLTVSYTAFCGPTSPAYGSYSPSRKRIMLATQDDSVFFHELAHAAHEKVKGSLKRGQDWQQEVVAELTAATLMRLYGRVSNDGGAYQYIAGYAESGRKDVYRACLMVINEVEECLNRILSVVQPITPAVVEAEEA